jgi:hypothetical protein
MHWTICKYYLLFSYWRLWFASEWGNTKCTKAHRFFDVVERGRNAPTREMVHFFTLTSCGERVLAEMKNVVPLPAVNVKGNNKEPRAFDGVRMRPSTRCWDEVPPHPWETIPTSGLFNRKVMKSLFATLWFTNGVARPWCKAGTNDVRGRRC